MLAMIELGLCCCYSIEVCSQNVQKNNSERRSANMNQVLFYILKINMMQATVFLDAEEQPTKHVLSTQDSHRKSPLATFNETMTKVCFIRSQNMCFDLFQ